MQIRSAWAILHSKPILEEFSVMPTHASRLHTRLKIFFVTILPLVSAVFAQAQTAGISGTITDASGGAVPGALVTAKNLGTAAIRTGTSDAAGAYSIANGPVGRYDITVEKEGFTPLHFQSVDSSWKRTIILPALCFHCVPIL